MNAVAEIYSMIPDSLLFGSAFLWFLTQNIAYGVFAIFILEMSFGHRLISWLIQGAVGPTSSRAATAAGMQCRAGFKTPRFAAERMFMHDPYPSYSVYSIASVGVYLALAMNEFKDTLKAMDKSSAGWSARSYVAYTMIGLTLVAFLAARMAYCGESFGELMAALLAATGVGIGLFVLNKRVFGSEAMNFLGLPFLVSKSQEGSPIYLCAQSAAARS